MNIDSKVTLIEADIKKTKEIAEIEKARLTVKIK